MAKLTALHATHWARPCPSRRHQMHPGFTCELTDDLLDGSAVLLGAVARPAIPAAALAGTSLGPGPRRSAV